MTPPEMLDEPASTAPTGLNGADADASLRTELVHRHLLARLDVAREQIQILEDHSPAPEVLVARFGTSITEAQRVLAAERALGREPTPAEPNNPGYDITSVDPPNDELLFIEVKGRVAGSASFHITKNEILHARTRARSTGWRWWR